MSAALYSPRALAVILDETGASFAALSVDSVDGTIPAGGTGMAAGAYDTAMNRDTMLATVTELKASVNALITALGVTSS